MENSLKWPGLLEDPQRGRDAVDFALNNNLEIRGHNIIWPSRKSMPTSVWSEYDTRVTNDGIESANAWLTTTIENRFDEVLNEFDGQIPEWDVVNEPWSNHDVMDILEILILRFASPSTISESSAATGATQIIATTLTTGLVC